jgi:hypothetical protein
MPTLESMKYVAASRPETVVSTAQSGWQHEVARLMRQRRRFVLETSCPTFDPSGYTAPSVWNWVRSQKPHITGCGLPGSLGVTLLGLTVLVPEPISRAVLASLGIASLVIMGRVVTPIFSARYNYHWRVSFNAERGTYAWIAEPVG